MTIDNKGIANEKKGGDFPPFATKQALLEGLFYFVSMFHVYVLYSENFQNIYIGMTSNLEERFKSHNELGTKGWTIQFRPWQIVYTEQFAEKKDALIREKQLKGAKGREFIWQLIQSR